jgi:hypothetical protein
VLAGLWLKIMMDNDHNDAGWYTCCVIVAAGVLGMGGGSANMLYHAATT